MNSNEGVITKRLFQRSMLTMIVAELAGAISAVIDGIIIGRFLGQTGLAAFGVATPYFSISNIISGVLVVGSTAMCTRAVGKGDTGETSRVFSLTLTLGIVLSVLYGLLGSAFSGGVASLFGAKASAASLHTATADYLRGVFIGAPGFILFAVLTPILQLDGDAVRPKLAGLAGAAVDIVGDLLVVFIFKGGMFGIGLASAISHYTELVIVLSHFLKKSALFRFSLRDVRFGQTFALIRDGVPRAASMLCRSLLPVLMNTLVLKLALDAGVTAMSTQNTTTYTVGAFGWGIGGAMLIVGGMMVGEQDVTGLKTTVETALKDILIGVSGLAVLVFATAPLITSLFIPEAGEAHTMALSAIRCYAAALPFLAFNVMGANYFQATGRTLASTLANIGIEVACVALLAYVLSAFLGVFGVWLAYPCGQALLSLVLVLIAVCKRDKGRAGLARYMLIPTDLGVPASDCIERSVRSMDEVIALSQEVCSFCAAHGIGAKETNRLSLCIEEMAGNVIEHGFSDGEPHHLDVRVVLKDGDIVLRLRDDCRKFDLKEKAADWSLDPEHPEENIGIRMVMRVAKDIAYTNTMNTNNLIVTI